MHTSAVFQRLLALVVAGLVVISAVPQASPSQSSGAQGPRGQSGAAPPAIRVTTRMVQISVIVRDKDGNPVTGLTKEDFKLYDEGQPQEIALFSEQTNRLLSSEAAPPSNLFSNRVQQTGATPRLIVVVLDIRNSALFDHLVCGSSSGAHLCGAVGRTFLAGEKFLSTLEPQDRVALYELADKLYVLHDFTSNRDDLLRALENGKQYKDNVHLAPTQIRAVDIASQTTGAMRAIGDHIANLPGRKSVVWLSVGFASASALNDLDIQKAVRALNNADAPLYAVDAKALVGPEFWPDFGHVGGGGLGGPRGGATPASSSTPASSRQAPARLGDIYAWFTMLGNIAMDSGGQIYSNTNDLSGAMHRAVDDSRVTYVLGYYPTHGKWDGEFRGIKVKVDRPGVEVRARKGYYASPDSMQPAPGATRKMADAVQNTLESADLGFDVLADPVDAPGARQLKVKISADAAQFHFSRNADRWTDDLEIVWAETDKQGRRKVVKSQTLHLKPDQEAYKELLQKGLSFTETLSIPAKATELRLIVRDTGSGAIGSVNIPLARLFASAAAQPATKK